MNNPTFRVGEEILSKTLMGRIQFAHRYEDTWFYVLEQTKTPTSNHLEQIQESDVLAVWRDNRWTTK